jgi:hypothetical protein
MTNQGRSLLIVKYDSAETGKSRLFFTLFQTTLYTYLMKAMFIEETKNRVFFSMLGSSGA